MAGGADVRAGKAFVELYVKNSRLVKGLEDTSARLTGFGQSLTGIGTKMAAAGAAIAGPMIAAVAHFAKVGDELENMHLRTGASTKALSELGYAASQSGSSLADIESALKKMSTNLIEAKNGSGDARFAFTRLGLSVNALLKMKPEDRFLAIADKISQLKSPAERTAAAMATMGKSATELLPLMVDGAKGIDALRRRADELGLSIGPEQAHAANELGSAWQTVKDTIGGVAFQIGASLAPMITETLGVIKNMIVSVNRWVQNNRELVRTVALVAGGVVAAGLVIVGLGMSFTLAGAALGGMATVLTTMAGVVAALLSPIGLLTTAVIGGVVAWVKFTATGRAAVASVRAWLGGLLAIAKDTMGGIADALSGGDLVAAAKVAWAGIKLVWVEGTQSIRSIWTDAKFWFLEVWQNATTDLAMMFTRAWAGIQVSWVNAIAAIQLVWNGFLSAFATAQNQVGNQMLTLFAAARIAYNNWKMSMGMMSPAETVRKNVEIVNEMENAKSDINSQADARQIDLAGKNKEIRDKRAADEAKINADSKNSQAALAADKAVAVAKLKVERLQATDATRAELNAAREEFKLARAKAAEVKQMAGVAAAAGIPGFGGEGSLATRTQSFSTFSSAAGIAAGFGGSSDARDEVARKHLDEAKKQRSIQVEQLALMDKNLQMMERFTAAMTHA